jgi:predicted nucleic acid-binding protein
VSVNALVVNASPLILLQKVDALFVLTALAAEVIIPAAVISEVRAGSTAAADAVERLARLRVRPDLAVPADVAAWDLGTGETQVLARALVTPGSEAVLDDRQGRRCAAALGIPATGTLGVVLRARRTGQLPAARPLVERLLSEGMYLSLQVADAALREVGE